MPALELYNTYTREDVQRIFCPDDKFTPQSGTWGMQGIIKIKGTKDFVFFVTLGSSQAGHQFAETITSTGMLSWQSQPSQGLSSPIIQMLIEHDHTINDIHLFFRQNRIQNSYYYLGRLAYVTHDPGKERPVYFQWQILNWNPPAFLRDQLAGTSPCEAMNCYSWQIQSNQVAIKKTDLSVFRHHGTGIPKQIRGFWDAEMLSPNEPKTVTLIWNHMQFRGYIAKEAHGRTRLFWYSDMAQKLRSSFPNFEELPADRYPYLRFSKQKENCYEIELLDFLSLDYDIAIETKTEFEDVPSLPSCEGAEKRCYTTRYERDPKKRAECIKIHGTKCAACGFDFEKVYGALGRNYIEVHHIVPLSQLNGELPVNPATDMLPLCSNCHRMIHRRKASVLSIQELRDILERQSKTGTLYDHLPAPSSDGADIK